MQRLKELENNETKQNKPNQNLIFFSFCKDLLRIYKVPDTALSTVDTDKRHIDCPQGIQYLLGGGQLNKQLKHNVIKTIHHRGSPLLQYWKKKPLQYDIEEPFSLIHLSSKLSSIMSNIVSSGKLLIPLSLNSLICKMGKITIPNSLMHTLLFLLKYDCHTTFH